MYPVPRTKHLIPVEVASRGPVQHRAARVVEPAGELGPRVRQPPITDPVPPEPRAAVAVQILPLAGCFGNADTPPTRLHALITATLAGFALVAAGRPGLEHGVALTVVTCVLAYLTYLALAVLPLAAAKAMR